MRFWLGWRRMRSSPSRTSPRPSVFEVISHRLPSGATPRRAVVGWDGSRLAMLLAVLEARAGLGFGASEVYLNVAGGLRVVDPAADLAVAKSSASSTRREVEQAFRNELEAQGCKSALENLSVDTTKEDGKWVINGDISMRRRIYGDVSVNYDFSVSSSRKSLWQ